MIKYWTLIITTIIIFSSCKKQANKDALSYFEQRALLEVTDSIQLEEYNILNPHYIYYKDSFLIFNSLQGERELQFLHINDKKVYNRYVIGQGKDEMINYWTVHNPYTEYYKFADTHTGRIYSINLDSLKNDSNICHKLSLSLPIKKGNHFFRFIETKDYILGVGIMQNGRIWVYNKHTLISDEQQKYPSNKEINKIDFMHKGALFSRTLLSSNSQGNKLVTACFGLLDFYSISDDGKLVLVKENHYHFPLFEAMSSEGNAITYKKEDIVGVTGLHSDEKYIYVLYSNKTFEKAGLDAYNASHLLLFDWSGKPIIHYDLPKTLYSFTLYENTLYGLSREKTPIVYCFKLNQ